jgi:hypothetical protein
MDRISCGSVIKRDGMSLSNSPKYVVVVGYH